MGGRGLLYLLLLVTGVWTKREDVDQLNLKSIFRVPRDFSTANFDHFELLERNNFHDQGNTESNIASKTPKYANHRTFQPSFANAQVLLRIGGDDLRDCSKVSLKQRQYTNGNEAYLQQQLPLSYSPYLPRPQVYPYQHTPHYPYPGYYFPPPVQNYGQPQFPLLNNCAQANFASFPDTTITYQEDTNGGNFLEGISYTDNSGQDGTVTENLCEDHAVDPIDVPQDCSQPENQSSGENAMMQGENAMKQGENAMKQGENAMMQGENAMKQGENAMMQGENAMIQGENAMMQGENAMIQGENAMIQGENAMMQKSPAKEILGDNTTDEGECSNQNIVHHPEPLTPKVAYVEVNLAEAEKSCLDTCQSSKDQSLKNDERWSPDKLLKVYIEEDKSNEEVEHDDSDNVDCTYKPDRDSSVPYSQSLPELSYKQYESQPKEAVDGAKEHMFQNSKPYFESTSSIQTSSVEECEAGSQQVSANKESIQNVNPSQETAEYVKSPYPLPGDHEEIHKNDGKPANINLPDWHISHSSQEEQIESPLAIQDGKIGEIIQKCPNSEYQSDIDEIIPLKSDAGSKLSFLSNDEECDESDVPEDNLYDQCEKQGASAENPDNLEIDVNSASNPSGNPNVKFTPATNAHGKPMVYVISENKQCDKPKLVYTSVSNPWDEPSAEVIPLSNIHDSPNERVVKQQFFREKYTVKSIPEWSGITDEVFQFNQNNPEESSREENEEYDRESALDSSANTKSPSDFLEKLSNDGPQLLQEDYSSCDSNSIGSFINKQPSNFGPFRIDSPYHSLDDYTNYLQPQRRFVGTFQVPYRQPILEQKIVSHVSSVADSYKNPNSISFLKQQPATHIYKIRRGMSPLNVPDFVSTNPYSKPKIHRTVPVPEKHCNDRQWPFITNLSLDIDMHKKPLDRDVPLIKPRLCAHSLPGVKRKVRGL